MNWIDEQLKLVELGFELRDCTIAGVDCVLIYPTKSETFNIKWTYDILHYRSSIWTKADKKVVSAGFKKFVNFGEREDLFPLPTTLKYAVAVEKVDGSCLLVSKFKGELIIRTRGTTDARVLDNGFEVDELIKKYPKAFNNPWINCEGHTLAFEWTTPLNRIVIDYGSEPQLFLTGCINHDQYDLTTQTDLDRISQYIEVARPIYYQFDTVENMLASIKAIKGKEGIVLYFGKTHQDMLKIKGDDYLAKHAFKSHCTINSIIDMFIAKGRPEFTDFMTQLQTDFDYECAQMGLGYASKVCGAAKEIEKILDGMKAFVQPLKTLQRKDAAIAIISAYGKTSRSGYVFSMLDNKTLDDQAYKKLLYQVMKE